MNHLTTPKPLKQMNLANRNVLLRLDLNVPMHQGHITSDARIVAALPTIQFCLQAGARLTVCSHLGRPKGQKNPRDSLLPVGERLAELLGIEVVLAEECVGDGVVGLLRQWREGQMLLLENLRFEPGEEQNDPEFARALAAPFQVYINDAFGASHRKHASIVGVPALIAEKTIGLLFEKEVAQLQKLLINPARPYVAIVGGAKVSDKVGLLKSLLPTVDALCIGGAMAYTLMAAQGTPVGNSRVETEHLDLAKHILQSQQIQQVQLLLPSDHIAANQFDRNATPVLIAQPSLPPELMGLDIGPQTRKKIQTLLASAQTVFWNGPLGVCEWPAFAAGTQAIAEAVASCPGFTVVGGGDSVAALESAGLSAQVDHVSTGGGASLDFLQAGTLVGLEALAT